VLVAWNNGKIGGLARYPPDRDRLEQQWQAGRRHHRVGGDLFARKDAQAPGRHIGRGDEQLKLRAGADGVEIDESLDETLQRIDIERIEVVRREVMRYRIEPRLYRRAFERDEGE
jgi:hypothetical protein